MALAPARQACAARGVPAQRPHGAPPLGTRRPITRDHRVLQGHRATGGAHQQHGRDAMAQQAVGARAATPRTDRRGREGGWGAVTGQHTRGPSFFMIPLSSSPAAGGHAPRAHPYGIPPHMCGVDPAQVAGRGAGDCHWWQQPRQPLAKALDWRSCHQPRARERGSRPVALLTAKSYRVRDEGWREQRPGTGPAATRSASRVRRRARCVSARGQDRKAIVLDVKGSWRPRHTRGSDDAASH